jgi:hypothetical protein
MSAVPWSRAKATSQQENRKKTTNICLPSRHGAPIHKKIAK